MIMRTKVRRGDCISLYNLNTVYLETPVGFMNKVYELNSVVDVDMFGQALFIVEKKVISYYNKSLKYVCTDGKKKTCQKHDCLH